MMPRKNDFLRMFTAGTDFSGIDKLPGKDVARDGNMTRS